MHDACLALLKIVAPQNVSLVIYVVGTRQGRHSNNRTARQLYLGFKVQLLFELPMVLERTGLIGNHRVPVYPNIVFLWEQA